MKYSITVPVSLLAILFATSLHAQYFGKKFTASAFAPPTVNGSRYYSSGQLFALLHTTPNNEEAYVLLDCTNGMLQAAFRLDNSHGVLASPDGKELLIAGNRTTNNQPVFFAGRYNATNLQPIALRQIATNNTSNFNLVGKPTPDGNFLFGGSHTTLGAQLVAKYGTNFLPQWGMTMKYRGAFANGGTTLYPLPNGDIGFLFIIQAFDLGSGGFLFTNVLGLIDGTTGQPKWSGTAVARQTATTIDEVKFVFGPDGSLLVSKKGTVLASSVKTNSVELTRITPNGTLAFSKKLTVNNAEFENYYYMAGETFAWFTFGQNEDERVQFVVLSEDGQVTNNLALNGALGSRGLTAARRDGTDIAFIRVQCTIPGLMTGPEHALARLNLTNGVIEFRKVPSPVGLGIEYYDLVTTPTEDTVAGQYSVAGFAAVTGAIVGDTDSAGGNGTVGLYELPCDGSYPSCLPLSASPVTTSTPLPAQLSEVSVFNLADNVTTGTFAMPGMTTPVINPNLQSLAFTENVVCTDDGTTCNTNSVSTNGPVLTIVRTNASQVTVSWTPATPGFVLQHTTNITIPTSVWSYSPSGATNPVTLPIIPERRFFRLSNP